MGKIKRGCWALLAAACAYAAIPKPPLKEGLGFSQAVYDRNGRLLRLTLAPDEKYRLWLPLDRISPKVVEAALLKEDRYFRFHPGFNPFALGKAAWRTYFTRASRMGGSTITMQVARMRYGIRSRTPAGKILQLLRAVELERHYSKDEILEAYLNLVPYGGNIEGVGAASLIYFGKDVEKLTLLEALTLTVIPKSPARRALGAAENAQADSRALSAARGALLERWLIRHPEDSVESPLFKLPQAIRRSADLPFLAPHFSEALLRANPREPVIRSTLDLALQRALERQVRGYVERRKSVGIRNAAALLVDVRSMEVKACVGSAGFFDAGIQGQVNGARARRSPGSALKPFVYGLGLDQGLIHPLSVLKDSPATFNGYNPENFERDFAGPVTVHDALIRSRNIPAIGVASSLKDPTFYEFLRAAGVGSLREESFYGLTLALGGAEATMEDMVRLYAMLANGGVLRPLRTRLGEPLRPGPRLLSEEASFMILDILKDNPRPAQGFRDDWTRDAHPVYWKTGTSYAFRDAWAVGIAGPYALAVWIGNFDGQGNPAFVGAQAAAPLFFDILGALKPQEGGLRPLKRALPPNAARVEVCAVSGQIPGPHCRRTVLSWFIPGKSPIGLCQVHREVLIDAPTGRRVCRAGPQTKAQVFEFWPSDLLKVFRQAGLPRRLPPAGGPDCALEEKAGKGLPPQITSPEREVTYTIRAGRLGTETIPLSAVSDADARELHWFVNASFVGRARSGEPFFWKAAPGAAVVRVVDDQGRADAREVKVTVVE